MKRRAAVAVIPLALLAACKADAKLTTFPPTSTTSTTSVEEGYRQQYLNFVSAPNCANDKLNKTFEAVYGPDNEATAKDWPRIQAELLPAFKTFADATIVQFQQVSAAKWPANAQNDIQQFVRLLTAAVSELQAQAAAKTFDEFVTLRNRNSPADEAAGNQAAAVRAILGLPTNLVDDGYDWCQGPPRAAALTQAIPSTTSTTNAP